MKRRCVIVGGANINDYSFIRKNLKEEDYLIFCDSGLKHLDKLCIQADLIIGDFDSYENPHMDIETIILPREKDDTDTVFAMKEAIQRGFEEFLFIGVIGERFDHSLGNVSMLYYLDSINKKGYILDDYSMMEIISKEIATISCEYDFFSIINLSGVAKGITIRNAKYPLEDAEITTEYQYGISNEVLPNKEATVSIAEGKLLLIKIRVRHPSDKVV